MKIGYGRVSTQDQNPYMQLDALERYGCEMIYKEKVSGTRRGRPAADEKKLDAAIKLYLTRPMTVREIAAETGVAPSTLYKYLAHHGYRRDRKKRA